MHSFLFFFIIVYHRTLNIVLCAIKAYFFQSITDVQFPESYHCIHFCCEMQSIQGIDPLPKFLATMGKTETKAAEARHLGNTI